MEKIQGAGEPGDVQSWALAPTDPPKEMLLAMCEAGIEFDVLVDDTRFASEIAIWKAGLKWTKEHFGVNIERILQQAHRYQFLRNENEEGRFVTGGPFAGRVGPGGGCTLTGDDLDAACDAGIARKAQPAATAEQWDFQAALDNLRAHQEQLDPDGVRVGVSRQALEEILALFKSVPPQDGAVSR